MELTGKIASLLSPEQGKPVPCSAKNRVAYGARIGHVKERRGDYAAYCDTLRGPGKELNQGAAESDRILQQFKKTRVSFWQLSRAARLL